MSTSDTQKGNILQHMENGKSITQLDALKKYGCMRLASVVHLLKKDGHNIEMQMVYNARADKRYASYYIAR